MAEDPYGGISGTSWAGMSVEAIWGLLKDHNSGPHREMGGAWERSAILLENHLRQVRSYRDRLADAWPPERSKASYAYLERLEQLITSLEETRLAANINKRALISAIDAVDESKTALDRIQKEYAQNQLKLQEFEKAQQETALATMDPLPTTPPVPYSRQAELEQQARNTMQSLSAELAAAQTTFIAPMPYSLLSGIDGSPDTIGSGGSGASMPSMIPPFSPRPMNPSKISKPTVPNSGNNRGTEAPNGSGPGSSKPSTEGPVLGGTKTQPPPTTLIPPTTGNPPPTTTPPSNALNPLTFTPGSPSSAPLRPPTTNIAPIGTMPPNTGARGTSLPPGGMIGGSPNGLIGGSQTGGRTSPAGSSARSTQRINPIGGLIGQDGTVAGGRKGHSRASEDRNPQHWDPDNPWQTIEGIDPVLLPSEEQRINPGPTIGGR
ncbi:hypothetical protein Q0Z83_095430 [Actinoplanes sichuanensis]|uniref:PPE family protein n=2 Tax=Actinoplanes sichuanensis TaxID=512349 RepID=A0ABW4AT82_9ACTN|nr:hypothetical protein [Actinoplanes sichuanensis]BEL11352.1 hypothetical protein Q0Z83_095430 [Actinoplanes sichuanensis]